MSQVNFILTWGDLQPGYRRALESAKVHGVPVILWHASHNPPDLRGLEVQSEHIEIPSWLKPRHQAHLFDVLAYQIGFREGGLVLGLDTISVRPALDLLGEMEVVVSTDWGEGDSNCGKDEKNVRHPYNNNFIARKGSDMAAILYEEAKYTILHKEEKWGVTGPLMLTRLVEAYPNLIAGAPYPALCGWAPGYLWRFYLGLEPVGPTVRIIHLCRSAYLALWEKRYEDWCRENPRYAAQRTTINDQYLGI